MPTGQVNLSLQWLMGGESLPGGEEPGGQFAVELPVPLMSVDHLGLRVEVATLSATGTFLPNTGGVALSLPDAVLAMGGDGQPPGIPQDYLTLAAPVPIMSAAGTGGTVATLSLAVGEPLLAMGGGEELACELPAPVFVGEGDAGGTGRMAVKAPTALFAGAGSGEIRQPLNLVAPEPLMRASGDFLPVRVGSLAISLPTPMFLSSAMAGGEGTLELLAPSPVMSAGGNPGAIGELSLLVPEITLHGRARKAVAG